MSLPSLEADCERCAALCCVLLPFDKSEAFAFDKHGGEPCRHLTGDHRCSIHDRLEARGFRGCIRFDCHGAGQRVVQELHGGRSWIDDPDLMSEMEADFRRMRRVHELLLLLREAARLPLTDAQARTCSALTSDLAPEEEWTREEFAMFDLPAAESAVKAFLSGLHDTVSRKEAD